MGRFFILIFLVGNLWAGSLLAEEVFSKEWWESPWFSDDAISKSEKIKQIQEIRKILIQTKQGRKLIFEAEKKDPKYFEKIHFGKNSLTETIFSRSFSLENAKESISSENRLYISKQLNRRELIFDFSHELTHFLFRKPHNPYTHEISLENFVRDGIEGYGGELDAFASECLVAWELEGKMNMPVHELCVHYKTPNGFATEKARVDYYAIGKYFQPLQSVKDIFPELSKKEIVFSSSLQKVPYPIAFIEEYANIKNAACENNKKKANLIAQYSSRLQKYRAPANFSVITSMKELKKEYGRVAKFLEIHCKRDSVY